MPGAMAQPNSSPLAEMASKVVAVPKSITTNGPPYTSKAATALTMRSAPTSRGLSVSTGRPVFTPGSTMTGRKPKYFSVISRNAAVTRGTTDEITIPSTASSKEKP